MIQLPVPVLSMDHAASRSFAQALGQSFTQSGFAIITDHGIDPDLIEQGWTETRAFFALTDSAKRRYRMPDGSGQRGFTPFATEIAKGAKLHDMKEFWHIGRELPPGHPLAKSMPGNVWPDERPAFRTVFSRLFDAFDHVGAALLRAIAVHLELAPDWFAEPAQDGNSILRLLHYPPIDEAHGAIRAGAHEDINLITLLLGAEEAGLELLSRDGRWLAVEPPAGSLVVNIGDMMQRLTNHCLPSTTHRVVNPASAHRHRAHYSMPFFLHLRPDFVITPLPSCVTAENPARDAPITAHDYLQERLVVIGLRKQRKDS